MKYFMVNTNRKADPNGHDEEVMLNEEIVALYFDGYKEKINKLSQGDMIFLYSNANGIIAYGNVEGKVYTRAYQGNTSFKGEEYFRRLKNFTILPEPMSVSEITEVVGGKIVMAQAFFKLSNKYALPIFEYLKKKASKLQAA
ncbi:MAG: hypothetical protein AABY64_14560 [Bdellovibrionota bacterium]